MSYVTYESDPEKILAKIQLDTNIAMRLALEDIHRLSRKITPMKSGALRMNTRRSVEPWSGTIVWVEQYSWYQERGYTSGPVTNYTTSGTGPWFARRSVTYVVGRMQNYYPQSYIRR